MGHKMDLSMAKMVPGKAKEGVLRPTSPQVQLVNVAKTYEDHKVRALRSISLSFEKGDFVAIMGPSGCGKSTLLNLIAGIDKTTAGQIFLEGEDFSKLADEELTKLRGRRIGFIFQFFNLLSTLTVSENVLLPLDLIGALPGRQADHKVKEMLARVGMSEKSAVYPSQLSGGEMQRVAIARALVHQPAIVLADEPTGNLDSENGESILKLLSQLNRDLSMTVLMATHSPDAAAYANRRLYMRDGEMVHSAQEN